MGPTVGLDDGGFLVAYNQNKNVGGYMNGVGQIQRFDATGAAIGDVFEINSSNTIHSLTSVSENKVFVGMSSAITTDSTNRGEAYGQFIDLSGTATTTTSTTTETVTTTTTSSSTEVIPAISLSSRSNANSALTKIDTALKTLNSQRASLGALSNRLDHVISNNTNASNNTQASLSRIQDADFAAETTKLAKSKILEQSSTAMLAQANASVYEVLTLIPD